jgi:uncharacterized pyridoxamine 5'-phosphate oxidase family protein
MSNNNSDIATQQNKQQYKHIIQAGMVKTTTIDKGIKTTNTRMQTPEEQLASLRKVLEATGMLK